MARIFPQLETTSLPRTPTGHGLEGSTQTYKRGAPLVLSSGLLVEASANPRDIVGFALADATGVTNTDTMYVRAMAHGVIQMRMSLDKAGSLGAHDLAQTDVGTDYGITKDSDGKWYVDIDKVTAGTNTCVVVRKLVGAIGSDAVNNTPTDTDPNPGVVVVDIMSEAIDTQQAAS